MEYGYCVVDLFFCGEGARKSVVFEGGLLYFRGGCGGRVKVACRYLYSIFK